MSVRIDSAIRSALVALLSAGALSVACPPRARAQDSAAVASQVGPVVGVLRPSDVLRLVVYRQKEYDGDYIIDSRGFIQIPGLGEVRVGGLNPVEAKARIYDQFRARGIADPDFSAQPLIHILVLGEVRTAGVELVEPGSSLIQVVTRAGGPTERADLRRTRVTREGRSVQVDLDRALHGSASGAVILNSNDVVYIPRRGGLTRENLTFALGFVTVALTIVNLVVTLRR